MHPSRDGGGRVGDTELKGAGCHSHQHQTRSNSVNRWFARRINANNAWNFNGTNGNLNNNNVNNTNRCQAVTN